ncbi:MAG: hypothetical protein AB9828_08655 [Sphaerochaetaceae bacterium]
MEQKSKMDQKSKIEDFTGRYVYAVTKHLPETQRHDVERELRTLIEDMLATRCGEKEPAMPDLESVLLELGSPYDLASSYQGNKRYLVGPLRFDLYVLLLKIVLMATGGGVLLAQLIGYIATPPTTVFPAFFQLAGTVLTAMLQAFAWVTLVFAIGQRYEEKTHILKEFAWDPKDLPEIPVYQTVIPRSESIVSLVVLVIFAIIVNFLPTVIFQIPPVAGGARLVRLFDTEVFNRMLMLINVTILLDMGVEFAKLFYARYTPILVALMVGLNTLSLVISIYICGASGIWNPNFMMDLQMAFTMESPTIATLTRLWDKLPLILISLMVVGFIIETITAVNRTFKSQASWITDHNYAH